MSKEKPEEGKEEKPETKPADNAGNGNEPKTENVGLDTDSIKALMDTVAGLGKRIDDIGQAVSALANQGAVNESIDHDNGNDEDDYPIIDLDKLMGV